MSLMSQSFDFTRLGTCIEYHADVAIALITLIFLVGHTGKVSSQPHIILRIESYHDGLLPT